MKYVIVCTLKDGPLNPPLPVSPQTQAFLESQDRFEEAMRAERIHWLNDKYAPKRRGEAA